jgi:hypothetical protein
MEKRLFALFQLNCPLVPPNAPLKRCVRHLPPRRHSSGKHPLEVLFFLGCRACGDFVHERRDCGTMHALFPLEPAVGLGEVIGAVTVHGGKKKVFLVVAASF